MEHINTVIAENLKRLREERKLSLDSLAKLTGVSKSMLGQIERGEVNPTVSTVWKISSGLKILFTQLMSRPEAEIEHVSRTSIEPLIEDQGRFRNYPMFSFDDDRRFEVYELELDGGGRLEAEGHPQGTQEFITVFSGALTVKVGSEQYVVQDGDSLRFKADIAHSYANMGSELCRLSMVIYYPRG